jgi:hypothetical protein
MVVRRFILLLPLDLSKHYLPGTLQLLKFLLLVPAAVVDKMLAGAAALAHIIEIMLFL